MSSSGAVLDKSATIEQTGLHHGDTVKLVHSEINPKLLALKSQNENDAFGINIVHCLYYGESEVAAVACFASYAGDA